MEDNNKHTEIDLPERAASDLPAQPKPIPYAMLHSQRKNCENPIYNLKA
jgi:hypothetical protein